MRKVSQEWGKSPVLVLSEGKWKDYISNPTYQTRLSKFSGLLYLQDNRQPKILHQIVDIKFSGLTKLSLQANDIESVEPISQLFCPKLVQLQLGDNKISSINSLRKANLENLKVLSLRKNKIIEFQPLQQLYSILRNALLEWYDDEGLCSDITWCVKLQTFQLKHLWLESRSRIFQPEVIKQVRNRFPMAKLSYNRMGGWI